MALVLRKTSDDRYEATVTPPHAIAPWATSVPLEVRQLIEELRLRGCHPQDIGDALYEQDPEWDQRLRGL